MFVKNKKEAAPEKKSGEKAAKKKAPEQEPQYYKSATNIQTLNYRVYIMSPLEKILYAVAAFVVGAMVGYLFYGGIGVDEFGNPTTLTYVLNTVVMVGVGALAARLFVPIRNEQLRLARQNKLKSQFRDMLEAISTSLNAGKCAGILCCGLCGPEKPVRGGRVHPERTVCDQRRAGQRHYHRGTAGGLRQAQRM